MMQPPAELAQELIDKCPSCSTPEEPVAVNGPSDSPAAVYKCSRDKTIWFADWKRSYVKQGTDTLLPAQPQCTQCGSALGQPHLSWCSFASK